MWRKSELINIDESSPCTINTYYIILRYCIVIVLFTSNSKKAAVLFSDRTSTDAWSRSLILPVPFGCSLVSGNSWDPVRTLDISLAWEERDESHGVFVIK